ncbi:hypothetical protein FYC62_03920 [Pedobacter aquae]|uniref:Uncharacterized protein n=1 Tax=Pedobacter aquae TaxID=2605747 RepID=A0A5C0VH10_9SPHI|nr:DUF6169 family protein [Pedobacter aquae]QEK50911.1 hypothetical protein FYC62_03920 [Pedobacter aquae]
MSLRYNITKNPDGSYNFITDGNIEYVAFFTLCQINDKEGNEHTVYSFGFEKAGSYKSDKFKTKYDLKVKETIIFIIKEFFKLNGDGTLIYFCFSDDEFARHRSITFSKWYRESLFETIEHHKKSVKQNDVVFYCGALIARENPLRELLIGAINSYFSDLASYKNDL